MENIDPELEKYTQIVSEISDLNIKFKRYREGNLDIFGDMSYKDAIFKIKKLKNLQLCVSKKVKESYAQSKSI
jgi:hypothetical protein